LLAPASHSNAPEKPVAHPKSLAYIPRSVSLEREIFAHFHVPGEDVIRLEGTLIEVLREAILFRVELANGHRLLGHVSQRRRREAAELKPGDKVNLEMSPFDFSKGRIVLEERKK
jgi:translation initiation factor IF-1